MRTWWPWRRTMRETARRPDPTGRDPHGRVYDGDRVPWPGQRRWRDLLDQPPWWPPEKPYHPEPDR